MNSFLLFLIILFFFNPFLIFAQPEALWTKTFGGSGYDAGHSVLETSDGGYIIGGVTNSQGAGEKDIWLIKTDGKGDTVWTKKYGGKYNDVCHSVLETSDNGYIICGFTKFSANENDDVWLIKTDINGKKIWSKTYGGIGEDQAFSLQKTSDEGYIIAGSTDSFGAGKLDMLLIKTNNNGDELWTRTYGGTGDDQALSVQQTNDGGYILLGSTDSYGAGRLDMLLIKTDAFGDTLWRRIYGGNNFDYGKSVQETSDGGYIVAGYTTPVGNTWGDVWIMKVNIFGIIQWTKTFGGNYYDFSCCIKEVNNGEYIIMASTESFGAGSSDLWLIKIDGLGNMVWEKTYGGFSFDYGLSLAKTRDGGFIITGKTASYGAGYYDVWLIKTKSDEDLINHIDSINNPNGYILLQNYPNPFNPITNIEFSIPQSSNVSLKIYNSLGQEVETLVSIKLSAGNYTFSWDATGFANSVYFYRIMAGDYQQEKKMILLK